VDALGPRVPRRRPDAVAGLVVAEWPDPPDAHPVGPRAHVAEEVPEVLAPPWADLDAPAAVERPARGARVIALRDDHLPGGVGPRRPHDPDERPGVVAPAAAAGLAVGVVRGPELRPGLRGVRPAPPCLRPARERRLTRLRHTHEYGAGGFFLARSARRDQRAGLLRPGGADDGRGRGGRAVSRADRVMKPCRRLDKCATIRTGMG